MRSVLLDTNALVLYIVGNLDARSLGRRRLEAFDQSDLLRLNEMLKGFQKHVTLPNVLTEASNLIGAGSQELVRGAATVLAGYGSVLAETYVPNESVMSGRDYLRVGLADAAILKAAFADLTVFTIDHELFGRLCSKGIAAVNLMHYKTPRGYLS